MTYGGDRLYKISLKKLQEIRIKKRWRKVELSRMLSPKSRKCPIRYHRIEKGITQMTLNDFLVLADAFEMTPEQLLKEIIIKEG